MKRTLLFSLAILFFSSDILAQDPNMRVPRKEDHFWRRKIVNRIDLNEKINQPLIARESIFYDDESQFTEKEGLVMALFNGLKQGKFVAYHADSLNVALSYEDVLQTIQDFEGSLTGDGDDFDELGDENSNSDFDNADFESDFNDFPGEEEGFGDFEDDFSDFDDGFEDLGPDNSGEGAGGDLEEVDPGPFENVIHFVEDRIFDKTRSDMVYNIQYIQLIWTDPGETLPEKVLCTFRYKDIVETLEATQWKNRFNDAEYKTLKEIFDLRLFHSYIIDVSNVGVRDLDEAEARRQQLIEFEHHLWSY